MTRPGLLLSIMMLLTLAVPAGVFAIANPDSMSIDSIRRYDNVAVAGDLTIIVQYTLDYTINPTENAQAAFIGRFMDGAAEDARTRPYPYFDSGYDVGLFAFYFATAPVEAATFSVIFQGDPTVFADTTGVVRQSSSIVTRASSDLVPDLRQFANDLELAWVVDLITPAQEGARLTANGEDYFTNTLANIREIAPDLFSDNIEAVAYPTKTYSGTAIPNFILAGTPYETGLQDTADGWGVDLSVVTSTVWFIIMVVVMGLVIFGAGKFSVPAEHGILTALIIGAFLLPVGGLIGFVGWALVWVLDGLLAVMVVGWTIFMAKAS